MWQQQWQQQQQLSRDTMVSSSWLGQLVCLHVDFSQVEAIRAHWSRAAIDEANVEWMSEWVCEYWCECSCEYSCKYPCKHSHCALLLPQIERITGLWNVQAKLICLSRERGSSVCSITEMESLRYYTNEFYIIDKKVCKSSFSASRVEVRKEETNMKLNVSQREAEYNIFRGR